MQHVGRRAGRRPLAATVTALGAQVGTRDEPRALRERVLRFAWPVIGQNLLETLLGVVGTVLVAGLGTATLAGVGSALQIMLFVLAALSALAVGSSILIA